jgi:hypothetical protein
MSEQHEVLGQKASETKPCFVVIHGLHTSTKMVVDYVEHIVYGHPRIDAVLVGSHFVAICEFPNGQWNWARGTFDRMGSFPHGAALSFDKEVAIREFGAWVYHYAPGTIVGLREAAAGDRAMVADMEAEGLL